MMQRIRFASLALSCALLVLAMSCGGGGSSSTSNSNNSGSGGSGSSTKANTTPVSVNAGPSTQYAYVNGIFVSVTVCQPGSTTACVTVPNVLLDTGSTGLRLLSDALTGITLPNVTSGGLTLTNCVQYLDTSYNWGPVATADISFPSSGEVASSVPIQIIASPDYTFPAAPSTCGGTAENTVDTLGANGVLGVSFYQQDCGSACAPGTIDNPGYYYACSQTATACSTMATVAMSQQLQNPIALFASDNNGLMLTMASVPASGAVSSTGTLTFGIGTQSDNALGIAKILTPDDYGNFTTTFNNTTTQAGFLDTGSNALFFLDGAASGIPECTGSYAGYYCPASTENNLTATNTGSNGATSTVTFSVANTETLIGNSGSNVVFSNLAGTGDDTAYGLYFDWGAPFFFGRTVYIALEGQTAAGTAGPYWAY